MNITIINADEVDIKDLKAQIMAELMFQNLMKQPPEIRRVLYQKLMDEDKTA